MSQTEVIDLTESEYFSIRNDRYNNSDVFIILDDSLDQSPVMGAAVMKTNSAPKSKNKTSAKKSILDRYITSSSPNTTNKKSGSIGDCPICLDELGINPLASTKCGHVYCLHCLKEALRKENKCPTCRTRLKGTSAYHPLYLS